MLVVSKDRGGGEATEGDGVRGPLSATLPPGHLGVQGLLLLGSGG